MVRVASVILAGGLGRRLAAPVPKPLVRLAGRHLIEHVLERLGPPVELVLVNANEPEGFAALGLPIVPDRMSGFQGPLAGLDAAGSWLRHHRPEITHLLSVPGDTPFLPGDLVERLVAGAGFCPRLAAFMGRPQPTVGLWPLASLDALPAHLSHDGDRSVIRFARSCGSASIAFPSGRGPGGDPFFNVNTGDDLRIAQRWIENETDTGKPF